MEEILSRTTPPRWNPEEEETEHSEWKHQRTCGNSTIYVRTKKKGIWHTYTMSMRNFLLKSSSEIVLSEATGQDKKERAQTIKINSSLAVYQNPWEQIAYYENKQVTITPATVRESITVDCKMKRQRNRRPSNNCKEHTQTHIHHTKVQVCKKKERKKTLQRKRIILKYGITYLLLFQRISSPEVEDMVVTKCWAARKRKMRTRDRTHKHTHTNNQTEAKR